MAPAMPEKKIVVIDDTELLLIFVEDILRTARPSLEIATAASGLEGVRRTTELLPDLVLLDYSLPDVAGDEVCRLLLEDARTSHIPVIMMSGHVAEMATTAARFPNVVATIGKPFLSAALIELVDATLANLPQVLAAPVQETPSSLPPPTKKARKTPRAKKVTKAAAKAKKSPSPPPSQPRASLLRRQLRVATCRQQRPRRKHTTTVPRQFQTRRPASRAGAHGCTGTLQCIRGLS